MGERLAPRFSDRDMARAFILVVTAIHKAQATEAVSAVLDDVLDDICVMASAKGLEVDMSGPVSAVRTAMKEIPRAR